MKDNRHIVGYVIISTLFMLAVATVGLYAARKGNRDTSSAGEQSIARGDVGLPSVEHGLLRYKETESIATGLESPSAMAVGPQDHIYVAGEATIRAFGSDGSHLMDFSTGADVSCIAVAQDGTLYAGLKDHVEVFDPQGIRKATWKAPAARTVMTSIALSGTYVFVADAGNRTVLQYDTSGTLLHRIGSQANFVVPSPYFDVVAGTDGLLRVANPGRHRIETYGPEGELMSWWGKPSSAVDGFSGCCNPAHFATLPDGRFVTSEKGQLRRIRVHSTQGGFDCLVAGPDDLGNSVEGLKVAVDSRGRILVLDQWTGKVRVFVPNDV
jgi:hypothetical protein